MESNKRKHTVTTPTTQAQSGRSNQALPLVLQSNPPTTSNSILGDFLADFQPSAAPRPKKVNITEEVKASKEVQTSKDIKTLNEAKNNKAAKDNIAAKSTKDAKPASGQPKNSTKNKKKTATDGTREPRYMPAIPQGATPFLLTVWQSHVRRRGHRASLPHDWNWFLVQYEFCVEDQDPVRTNRELYKGSARFVNLSKQRWGRIFAHLGGTWHV